jgi:hypothetical protein
VTNIEFIVQVVFVGGFVFAFFIDHIPLSLRVVGFKLDAFPLSTLRSSQIMILNRFGAAFFFTSAGFLVDIGISPERFLALFSLAWALVGFLSLLYIRCWRTIYKFTAFYAFGNKNAVPDTRVIKFTFRDVLINYPFLFNLIGISIPVIAASYFPDFRGTLLQIGFLFNSIATLLVVFVVEPKFIGHISNDEAGLADEYHQRLLTSKALLLLSMSCIAWLVIYLM